VTLGDAAAHSDVDGWLPVPVGVAAGVVLAGGTLAALASPSVSTGTELAALILTLVYAIYVGFVLTRGGIRELVIEIAFVTLGLLLTGLGLWRSPEWLAAGFALHGIWDLLHHRDHHLLGVRGVPVWYVPTCAAYHWIVAIGVLVILR
jgi:hypothetical protein